MTPRERLFAVLDGQPTDRLPIWLLFPYHPTGYYVDVRTHPGYREIYEYSRDRVIMLNRRNPSVPLFRQGFDPGLSQRINCDEQLDDILRRPILQDKAKIEELLKEQLEHYLKEKDEFPSHYGAMMLDLGEPVNWLYHNLDMQEYAVWSLTRPGEIKEFLDQVYQ